MGHKKLKRFAEIKTFSNVLEHPANMGGAWSKFFQNNFPITLELACGKGEYAVGLAQLYPSRNFIGIDIKGNRIWAGAKLALEKKLSNVAFVRTQIEKLPSYFQKNEVDEIWITFPDPQLRLSRAKKRLTHPRFLRLYSQVLKSGGHIHLKTDSPDLYHFTKKVILLYDLNLIADIPDVHRTSQTTRELGIKTYYEQLDIAGRQTVFYLCFSLPGQLVDNDKQLMQMLKDEATIDERRD